MCVTACKPVSVLSLYILNSFVPVYASARCLSGSVRLQIYMFSFVSCLQVEHIERIFSEAQKQRASDHFSKAQRKSIDVWCKQIQVGGESAAVFTEAVSPYLQHTVSRYSVVFAGNLD